MVKMEEDTYGNSLPEIPTTKEEIEEWKNKAYIFSVNTIYISELNDFLIFVYYDLRDLI